MKHYEPTEKVCPMYYCAQMISENYSEQTRCFDKCALYTPEGCILMALGRLVQGGNSNGESWMD